MTPLPAYAEVEITEILYDVSGTDSGHEWVEITNTGTGAVDVSGYKFFEANTNHALTLLSGTGILQPQSSALIIQDQTKFSADYPSYSGTLFKASFDLSNSGETLGIKQTSTSGLDDSVTYDASMGANGDGQSLQRSGATFVAKAPTPGTTSSSGGGGGNTTTETSTTTVTTVSETKVPTGYGTPPIISAQFESDDVVMVGGGSFFSGHTYGKEGYPLSGARYLWNFGDGATAEGQKVFHTYSYPGTYAVILTVANDLSTASAKKTIQAVPAQVALFAESDGSVVLSNKSKEDMNVGLWMLLCSSLPTSPSSGAAFTIPENTTLLAGGGIRFAPTITNISCGTDARLLYPNGSLAADAGVSPTSPLRGQTLSPQEVSAMQTVSKKVYNYVPIAAEETPSTKTNASELGAAAAESATEFPWWGYAVAAGALTVIGAGAAMYARVERQQATLEEGEEFDIE